MSAFRITTIRYDENGGRAALGRFVFAGKEGGPRVPRGVPAELVSEFILQRLKPDSSPEAYRRTAEVVRFYERADVVPHIGLALNGRVANQRDLMRSAHALQTLGEFGSREQAAWAAQYFDALLTPRQEALDFIPLLLDTLVSLAPAGTADKLRFRLQQEVQEAAPHQYASEARMMAYDRLCGLLRNDLPRAQGTMAAKENLLKLTAARRRGELLLTYLGQSPHSGSAMATWAGRMLRKEAMEGEEEAEAVRGVFARAMELAEPEKLGRQRAGFIIHRAAQAIVYLGGRLSPRQRDLYEKSKPFAAMNFLWDDLEGPNG